MMSLHLLIPLERLPNGQPTSSKPAPRANQAVANLDAFMAKYNYAASDVEDITITAVGEPSLHYLAGVFTGVDAEFIYRSAGNGYEVQVTASDSDYTRDRNYWARFNRITGDEGESAMRVRPDSPERADTLQARLRQLGWTAYHRFESELPPEGVALIPKG